MNTPEQDAWLQTASGGRAFPLDLQPDQIKIEDIAHSLAMQCRFNGHCPVFYSVAEHSVHVAQRAVRRVAAHDLSNEGLLAMIFKQGLLHDAAEAYLVDIPAPLKKTEIFVGYRALEQRILTRIFVHFELPDEVMPDVKEADIDLLWYEACVFFGQRQAAEWPGLKERPRMTVHTPLGLPPKKAKELFLSAFYQGR